MRVLIVDDDPSIRHVVRIGLDGLHVFEAQDGPSALALLYRQPVDVVLLDVMMPGMSGFDVLAHIRSDEMLTATPVVMLTAKVGERDHLRAFDAGADGYLAKPFDFDELAQTVTDVAGRSLSERHMVRERERERAELLARIEIRFGS